MSDVETEDNNCNYLNTHADSDNNNDDDDEEDVPCIDYPFPDDASRTASDNAAISEAIATALEDDELGLPAFEDLDHPSYRDLLKNVSSQVC